MVNSCCPFWWKLRTDRRTGRTPRPEDALTREEYKTWREWYERPVNGEVSVRTDEDMTDEDIRKLKEATGHV